jgi:hypothetical protein
MVLHFDFCVKDNATPAKSMYTPYDIMVKLEVMFGDQNHDDRSQRKMGTSRKAGASIISRHDTKRNYPDI